MEEINSSSVNEEKNVGDMSADRETVRGFTPGPWKIETPPDRDEEDTDWDESYPRGVTVRAAWNTPREDGALGYEISRMSGVNEHTMANARLIAAAPSLYEALKNLVNCRWVSRTASTRVDEARAALALVDAPDPPEVKE